MFLESGMDGSDEKWSLSPWQVSPKYGSVQFALLPSRSQSLDPIGKTKSQLSDGMDQVAWGKMKRCDGWAGVVQNMTTWWKDVSISYGLSFFPNPKILIGKVTAELSTVMMSNSGSLPKNGDSLKHPDCKFLHGRCKIEMVLILRRLGDGQRHWEVESCRHVAFSFKELWLLMDKNIGETRSFFNPWQRVVEQSDVIGAVSSECLRRCEDPFSSVTCSQ